MSRIEESYPVCRKLLICLIAGVLFHPGTGWSLEVVDRIVAVVGNDIILLSELRESVTLAARQLNVPAEDSTRIEGLMSEILKGMVEEKVILQRAKADGIEITEEELDAEVEKDLEKVIARFGSREEFERALSAQGLDLYGYRDQLKKEKEKQLIQQRFIQKSQLPYAQVTMDEARAYFDERYKDRVTKPASVRLREVVLDVKPSEAHLAGARERAADALRRIEEGAEFEGLARELSQDALTREKGGDLGFVAETDLLPALSHAVRNLLPGEISRPVETVEGVHLFRVIERKVGAVHLAHILFVSDAEGDPFEETMALARELADRAKAGEDFATLSATYSTNARTKEGKGLRGEEAIETLPDAYRPVVDALDVGGISEPFTVDGRIVIVKVEEKSPVRPYQFEEVKDQLLESLAQEKAYQQFIENLEKKTYVDIRLYPPGHEDNPAENLP